MLTRLGMMPWMGCRPEHIFFVAPRCKTRGLLKDAVPNEVKDASLTLGRTKKGRSARRSRGTFRTAPELLFPKGVDAKDPVN